MHKLLRKIALSFITSLLVLITMIATTYAWVGMLSYSTVGEFNINLKTENKNTNYSLFISPTGDYNVEEGIINDSFKEQLTNTEIINIKKQILINMGKFSDSYLGSAESINSAFNRLILFSSSPSINDNKVDLSKFMFFDSESNTFKASNYYYKFDIYLSVDSTDGELTESTTYLLDLYIKNIADSLMGQKVSGSIINGFNYNENYLDGIVLPDGFNKLGNITPNTIITTDSSYSSRLALEYYEGIPITSTYNGNEKPIGQFIYQAGTQIPVYDEKNSLYSFGGVVPKDDNISLQEYFSMQKIDIVNRYNDYASVYSLPNYDSIVDIRKNDLLLEDENNIICEDTNKLNLGIINGQRYKSKVTIYFWYEGWDADNFRIINNTQTSINLTFASNFKEY